ncbi:MAG: hypothetical protein ACE5F1_05380 [Planctomycetota bacterium]
MLGPLFAPALSAAWILAPLAQNQEIRAAFLHHGSLERGWVRVEGPVELSPEDAIRGAERAAAELLWKSFAPGWLSTASSLVPKERTETRLKRWVERNLNSLPVLEAEGTETLDVSVGTAYRSSFLVQVRGPKAVSFRSQGERLVARVSREHMTRYACIGAAWLLLLLLAHRLDRSTRGYLTGRIRCASVLAGILCAYLLLPS